MTRVLDWVGHATAADGLEAVNFISKRHCDLIFMDVHMPNLDGRAACQAIRRLYGEQQQPIIIALTASVMQDSRDSCLDSGMDDHLSKLFRSVRQDSFLGSKGSTLPKALRRSVKAKEDTHCR
jgi:CheY-like chemotaxis protein